MEAAARETANAPCPGRLPSLTGLRFLAAAMVFFGHAFADPLSKVAAPGFLAVLWYRAGSFGVSFFFILSGFVLAWSARAGDRPVRFLRRRLLKVYPNHLVTFGCTAVLLWWTGRSLAGWLPNLLLVQSWVPDFGVINSVNTVSWTLSCEVFFYAAFPLLMRWTGRIRPERLWHAALGTVAGVVAVPWLAQLLPARPRVAPPLDFSFVQWWFVNFAPPVRVLEFVLGILLARIVLSGRWIRLPRGRAAALVALSYVVALAVPYLFGVAAVGVVPLGLLIASVAVADTQGESGLLAGRTMTWLGEISFAFYLVHRPLLIAVSGVPAAGAAAGMGIAVLVFAVAVLVAWALYAGVERPVMRRWAVPRAMRRARESVEAPSRA
ncbi:putative acyltransferase [Streptomyces sp. NBRC 110611]|uniref:acyltransferase family protein n=1 Tax=Streptomyces sp. NBRC 110611 TaxID=1621259 RepID=UPI000829D80C|nr:acyltransferase [Streptomyces sp. NBRC 110611]GAU67581.1 putative acyltransferase [Streptomyces sp. NBRC 110611]